MRERRVEWAALAAVALAVTLALHRPLWPQLGHAIPGEAGTDVFRAHWSVWLTGAEFPSWPFSTERVNFPRGVDWIPFPAVTLWVLSPLTALLGPDLMFPLMIALHTAAAVGGGWLLARALGAGLGGAAVAGAMTATMPILGGALRDGTLEVLTVGWMPAVLAAMIYTCRGSLRWGIATGLLYLCMCMESVYQGSFMAPAVVACLFTLRSRRGVAAAGLSGVVVALGAAGIYWVFKDTLGNIQQVMGDAGDDLYALQKDNAATLVGLKAMALSPGSEGWMVGKIYAPPLAWWVAAGAGAVLSARRTWWVALLALFFTGLAILHPAVYGWYDTPIGEVVRFPRRYMAAAGVMMAALAGVGLSPLRRWPKVEIVAGLGLAAWLGAWGAHAGGFVRAYPLVKLPEVAFADAIAEDTEDAAALLVPLEVPGDPSSHRDQAPVFANLSSDIASADHLYLQTRMNKRAWYAPSLLTLSKRERCGERLHKNLSDLAFGAVGQIIPPSSTLQPADYANEITWLLGEGFKYVVFDKERFLGEAEPWVALLMDAWSVEVKEYGDGSGVVVYRLYDERPERTDPPCSEGAGADDPGGASGTGQPISGNLVGLDGVHGKIEVIVTVGGKQVSCDVRQGDRSFICPDVYAINHMWVKIDGVVRQVKRPPELVGATILVLPEGTEPQ